MKRIVLVVTVGIVMATLLALTGPSFASHGPTDRYKDVAAELKQWRQATSKYHDVENAVADGYVAPTHKEPPHSLNCVSIGLGGMGYHFVHRQDVLEGSPFEVGVGGDPLKPEAMLYEKQQDGELRLVAVEWIVRDADQDLATHNDPQPRLVLREDPLLFEPFHGPMEGHEYWAESPFTKVVNEIPVPWMPYHYDLHAWIWKDNPRGVFDDWNPNVSCP